MPTAAALVASGRCLCVCVHGPAHRVRAMASLLLFRNATHMTSYLGFRESKKEWKLIRDIYQSPSNMTLAWRAFLSTTASGVVCPAGPCEQMQQRPREVSMHSDPPPAHRASESEVCENPPRPTPQPDPPPCEIKW